MPEKETENLIFQEVKPHRKLERIIHSYWKFEFFPEKPGEAECFHHTVLPDGCVSLIMQSRSGVTDQPAILFGPRTGIYETDVRPETVFVGIRFFPGVVKGMFGITGEQLRDQVLPVKQTGAKLDFDAIQNQINRGFDRFELLDEYLFKFIDEKSIGLDPDIRQAVKLILNLNGVAKVSEIAARLRIGERQLQRKFRREVGLTVKEFARIRRLRQSLINLVLREDDLHDVIFRSGYFDQAHFNRDFSMIVGTNPTKFLKFVKHIAHENVEF